MQAIRVHAYGGPDVLRYEELPTPTPGPDDVVVRLDACGVNYVDIYQRMGLYKMALPYTPGSEGAGTVADVGAHVRDLRVGARVAYCGSLGAYTTHALVPAARLVALPETIGSEQAAALFLQGITAHYLCHSTYPVRKGDTALIHAAAGGVGLLLVQMAKMLGARIIATVSTKAKALLAREAGADEVILYTEDDFEVEVKRLTGGRGVQVAYDSVGKTTFDQSLNCLAPRGTMVLFGQASGPVPPMDPQILAQKGSLFLTRPTMGHYIATREELLARAHALLQWVASGRLRVRIDRTFPLAQAADAHRALESRATAGKVLLLPA